MPVEDLLAVVGGARVELDRPARERIAAARAVVDEALAAGSAVYGRTTRVGHLRDTRLTAEEVHREQEFLVRSHAGGIAPATLDVPPQDLGIEDHATAAPGPERRSPWCGTR